VQKTHYAPAIGNRILAEVGRQGFLQEKYYWLLAIFGEAFGKKKASGDFFAKTNWQVQCNATKTLPTCEEINLPIAGAIDKSKTIQPPLSLQRRES